MDENIECGMIVSKITYVNTDDLVVTAILKGTKTVTHNEGGFDTEDHVDFELKLKCGRKKTLALLGVELFMDYKILGLRNRDSRLTDFRGESQKVVE